MWETQPGSQRIFETCPADIAIYVGQPGSGKSVAGILDGIKWTQPEVAQAFPTFDPARYTAAGFRRNAKQLMGGGGLWSILSRIARADHTGVQLAKSPTPTATWSNGATFELHHAQYAENKEAHDGKEYAVEFFDELPHFDAEFFWYLALLRNRTLCGLRPYVRASAMATPDCFVHDLVKPWLLPGGWPDYAQSGRVRWFVRSPTTDELVFFERREHALEYARSLAHGDPTLQHLKPKSLAVIHARTEENKQLMAAMPDYLSNIAQGDRVTRMRMQGCWDARPLSAGMFDRAWYEVLDSLPENQVEISARGWDKASSKPSEEYDDPDWTRGVRLDLLTRKLVVVSDVVSIRDNPGKVDELYCKTAEADGPRVTQRFWRDPGQAGDVDESHTREKLAKVRGCGPVVFERASKNKITYAAGASAYADKTKDQPTPGFGVVRATWNGPYFAEVEEFPRPKKASGEKNKDDQIDAQSAAWLEIETRLGKSNAWIDAMRAQLDHGRM